jgi:integrase
MARYRWLVNVIKRDKISMLDVAKITSKDLYGFAVRLAKEVREKTQKPYGKNTIINTRQVVHMAHKYAAINGYCKPIVYAVEIPRTHDYYTADKLKNLSPKQAELLMKILSDTVRDPSVVPWSDEVISTTVRLDNNRRYALGCMVGLGCGLRISEVCALETSKHIDTSNRCLWVTSAIVSYTDKNGAQIVESGPTKSKASERMVPLPKHVAGMLARYAPDKGYLIPADKSIRQAPNKRGLSTWFSVLMHSLKPKGMP